MRSRSIFDLQDPSAGFEPNFSPAPHDVATEPGSEAPAHEVTVTASVPDVSPVASEDGSAHDAEGAPATTSFTLLDTSSAPGHPTVDPAETSTVSARVGAGSINIIGTLIQETTADNATVGLHIAPLADNGFTDSTAALFGPAATLPASFTLADLAPTPFAHGADTMAGAANADTGTAHATPAESAGAVGVAFLENSGGASPTTNSGVGTNGATTSQLLQALDESGLSVNGSSIKVGVLSDSFNDLGGAATDEADGTLPSSVQVLKDLASGGSDEGRAMMEIIHDIAPGASLAFYTAFNSEQDFANGILALANAGAKVIVDDVGYFDEPFFQNGVVAQAIQTVEAEGVTYVTAAGNEGSNGYQSAWTTTSGTFDGRSLTNAMSFGGSITQTVTINTEGTGDSVPLVLEWNQAYGAVSSSTADLELLVFHNGSLVGTATNASDGEASNPWVEYNFSSSGTYQVAIINLSAASTDSGLIIKEITEGDGLPATISGSNTGTVVGHSMTPGAISAGAVSAADTPAFGFSPSSESFSSSGAGAELLFANNGTPLSSPDLLSPVVASGIDDIATSVPGGLSDFYGTSAASASLAGVAALILSADPNLTPAQVEAIMEQTALSMGNAAIAGAGFVQVDPAVAAALRDLTPFAVTATSSMALQGGADVKLLSASPVINDYPNTTLASATIKITNSGGSAVAGDELFVNGTANGPLGSGVTASWNAATDTLTLTGSASIATYETLLSEVTFQDTGTDTSSGSHPLRAVTWTINDGTNSFSATSTINVDRAPVAVANTATDAAGATVTVTAAGGVLSNDTDLDGDSLTVTAVSDTSHGAGVVGTSLAGAYGHLTLNANGSYSYVADNTTAINSAATGSHLQDVFTYTVSDGHGGTASTSLTVTLDRAPVVTAANVVLSPGQTTVAASSLFSATDPDGNSITTYAFKDTGPGHFVLNGTTVEPNGQEIDISAAQLSQLTYQSVVGYSDTLQVRVNDGTLWSGWTSFTVAPSVTIEAHGVTSLVEVGNDYFLDPVGGGTGAELFYNGALVTVNMWAGWTPVGAEQVSGGGYDVAFYNSSSNTFNIWSVDSSGHYISNLATGISATSTTLENYETTFDQDLNGDSIIGPPPGAPAPLPTVVEHSGQTALLQSGSDYFLNPVSNLTTVVGPELTYSGAPVTVGMWAGWTPVGAEQVSGGGYDVAFYNSSSNTFNIWSVDSSGHYLSNLATGISAASATLENYETVFDQDLNGDSIIGPPSLSPPPSSVSPTVVEHSGQTALLQSGNDYFLNPASNLTTLAGPELTYNGSPVTANMWAGWNPVAAEQVSGGYDVAFYNSSSNTFNIWSVDSSGHYISNLATAIAATSTALENYETIFQYDLNGDGTVGPPSSSPPAASPTVIEHSSVTALLQSGNDYFLNPASNLMTVTGPELIYGGSPVTANMWAGWNPVAAEQVSGGGYDVAFYNSSSDTFNIWSVDSSGNYISNLATGISGSSTTLENYETIFQHDLNGDGTVGPLSPPPSSPTVIEHSGQTALLQSGGDYFLNPVSNLTTVVGPELTYNGSPVTENMWAGWNPVAAEQVGSGFDVAFQNSSTGLFNIWSVDSNGNYVKDLASGISGTSTTLINFETIFDQDLNGNGTVGSSIKPQTAGAISPDNFQFHTNATAQPPSLSGSQTSAMSTEAHEAFAFASGANTNSAPAADTLSPNSAAFASHHAAWAASHDDALGNSATPDAAHLQWLAHHSDFHFV